MKYLILNPGLYFFAFLIFLVLNWKHWSKKRRTYVLSLFLISFYLTTTPFVFHLIAKKWESQYPPFSIENIDDISGEFSILILGSGHNYDRRLSSSEKLGGTAKARVLECLRIKSLVPLSGVITSGHSGSGRIPAAVELKNALVELGVSKNDILMQTKPSNTRGEAMEYKKLFSNSDTRTILVTSAAHMPRALNHFENAGVKNVIPAPCDFLYYQDNTYNLLDFVPKLGLWSKFQKLNKEVLGYYFQL